MKLNSINFWKCIKIYVISILVWFQYNTNYQIEEILQSIIYQKVNYFM